MNNIIIYIIIGVVILVGIVFFVIKKRSKSGNKVSTSDMTTASDILKECQADLASVEMASNSMSNNKKLEPEKETGNVSISKEVADTTVNEDLTKDDK